MEKTSISLYFKEAMARHAATLRADLAGPEATPLEERLFGTGRLSFPVVLQLRQVGADVTDLQPGDLAGPQPATVREAEERQFNPCASVPNTSDTPPRL